MSNLSVKLDESTHLRLKDLALRQGMTPHALMVQAIGGELDRIEAEIGFVERAVKAQVRAEAGGPVYDGPAFALHLRERVQAAVQGRKSRVKAPKPTSLATPTKKAGA